MLDETGVGTVEEQAARMGWSARDEFKGDPERWVPAEKFVERAETVLPIAKGTIDKMQRLMVEQEAGFKKLLADQKAELDALKVSTEKFVEFAKKGEERAYERALKELKVKQLAAAEDRDVAGVEAIGKEIEDHIKSHPAVTGEAPPDKLDTKPAVENTWIQPGVFEAWKEENAWYTSKPKMFAFAKQADAYLMENKPGQTQKERLAGIVELVKEEFPEFWANLNKTRPGAVEPGNESGFRPPGNGKGYAHLTAEAKAYCDEFAGKDGKGTSGTIPGFTRDDYLAKAGPECFK